MTAKEAMGSVVAFEKAMIAARVRRFVTREGGSIAVIRVTQKDMPSNFLGYAYESKGEFNLRDPVYLRPDGTVVRSVLSCPSEPKEWKLSEGTGGPNYINDVQGWEYTFPDGTRTVVPWEAIDSFEKGRDFRVTADPPRPISTATIAANAVTSGTATQVHWGSTSLPPDPLPSEPTKWSASNLSPREWLRQRVDEMIEMGRLATKPEYAVRGVITSGAA